MAAALPREARRDLRLRARVLSSRKLYYREGADPASDRPAYVRSASGICRFAGRFAIVQDDANFIALLDDDGSVSAVPLPAGPAGARQFDDVRGNKAHKADIECCFTFPVPDGELLVGLGSGSTAARERAALLGSQELSSAALFDAAALYEAFRARADFVGSELNLEGATLLDDGRVQLFQRGNGAPRDGLDPVNATAYVAGEALLSFLQGGSAVPSLSDVVQWQLGDIAGVRLTFTDATTSAGRVWFLCCAEDSPDAVRDGPVAGTAVGVFDDDGGARWAPLEEREGAKAEGLVLTSPGRGFLVLDPDDPAAPGELCELELKGPWLG